MKRGETRKLT